MEKFLKMKNGSTHRLLFIFFRSVIFWNLCVYLYSEDSERKSLSTEQTFTEINKPSEQYEKCLQLCEALAADLQNEGLMGRTITVKLKTVDFDVKTRSQSIAQHTADKDVIYQVARELIKTEITACSPKPFRLRLMGVRISNFLPKTQSKKKDTIDCFVKKKHPLSSDSERNNIDLLTESNRTIPSHDNSPPPNAKPPAESPAGHYCPICNRKCPTDLRIFNAHIDKCLMGGKHSRSSQKRSSQPFNKEFLTENASQNVTPLKVSKQRRGKISKTKMAQITFGMASSHEGIASQGINQDKRGDFAETDVVVISSNEDVIPQEEMDVPSPVFDRVPTMKLSFPETLEKSENFSIRTIETSSRTAADLDEKRKAFPCNTPFSCFNKNLQIIDVNQPKTVMKSTFPVTGVENPSVSLESLSCVDRKQNSNFNNNQTFPIKESWDKDSKSETNSLNNDSKNHTRNKEIVENISKEELPILQSVYKSEATDKLSPQAKVMPCSALSLKDKNKNNWLEMLQKCSKNETISPETQLTESKKIKMDSVSPSTKKSSANHCVMKNKETSSKSVRNLLQYFSSTASKTCGQNSNLVQQTNSIGNEIKTETISPKSPSKSHNPKILTIPLCQRKEEDPIYVANEQVWCESDCDSARKSSNKMCRLDSDVNVSCKYDSKLQLQPERLASVKLDHKQSDVYAGDNSHTKNVSNGFEIIDKQTSSSSRFNNPNVMTSKVTALSSSFNPLTTNSYKETRQTHRNTSFTNHKFTTHPMQSLASTYEDADESEASSEENFSQPFHEEQNCKEDNRESICLSENEPEISLQNSRQSIDESLEDTDAFGETVTCPVCSKQLSASDMTTFNEHVDLCLNQDVIHNILIEQGKEIKKAETMKRRADLLSPLLKTKKKKKYKNDTKNNKDPKLLTLHSFFS